MNEINIEVQPREETGSAVARRLRREGKIPAVVYGGDRPSVPITVDKPTLLSLLRGAGAGSENAVFLLRLGGSKKQRHCMMRDVDLDPVTREIRHLDFLRIDMKEKIVVSVAVELVGSAPGATQEGGILDFITRELEVECLPGDIPDRLPLDVSELHIGDNLAAGDVPLPDGVELMEEADRVVASVVLPRIEEEPEEEEEEMLLEAEDAEPELVGREGEEEEAEGEEAGEEEAG